MAKLSGGLFGKFSGKIGNIVGYQYKGQQCIKKMPVKSCKAPTSAQLVQRKKLAVAAGFIKTLGPFLNQLPDKKGLSCARSTLAQGRITRSNLITEGDGYRINYELVLLCEGPACNISVSLCASPACISFACSSGLPNAYAPVEAYLMVWLPQYGTWLWHTAAFRNGRTEGIISIPGLTTETAAETYVICLLENGRVSASRYTGQLTIPAALEP